MTFSNLCYLLSDYVCVCVSYFMSEIFDYLVANFPPVCIVFVCVWTRAHWKYITMISFFFRVGVWKKAEPMLNPVKRKAHKPMCHTSFNMRYFRSAIYHYHNESSSFATLFPYSFKPKKKTHHSAPPRTHITIASPNRKETNFTNPLWAKLSSFRSWLCRKMLSSFHSLDLYTRTNILVHLYILDGAMYLSFVRCPLIGAGISTYIHYNVYVFHYIKESEQAWNVDSITEKGKQNLW